MREAMAAILGNQVTAGVSSVGEFQEQVKAGTMRLLAVSSAERLPGVDAPTIKEAGFDVVVENWRMVAAAPGLSDEQKAKISADIEKLNAEIKQIVAREQVLREEIDKIVAEIEVDA